MHMKTTPDMDVSDNWPIQEDAELHKKEFLAIVKHLAPLRDLQYKKDLSEGIIQRAEKVMALNLPSNLLRAAAIFVDHTHGFPPGGGSFFPPAWITATELLPEHQRGSLRCEELKEMSSVQEGDVVVLTHDLESDGLHAGMSGIVRELLSDDDDDGMFRVEFGEPEETVTLIIELPGDWLRPPRPGDLLENYRL
jgi:hypothetical protein